VQKDFEAFIGQGEQAQGRSWRLAKGGLLVYVKKRKKRRKENEWEEDCFFFFCSYVWRGAHGRCVCED
jgi:hypothetical protein